MSDEKPTGTEKDLIDTHKFENEDIPAFNDKVAKFMSKLAEHRKRVSMLDVLQGIGGTPSKDRPNVGVTNNPITSAPVAPVVNNLGGTGGTNFVGLDNGIGKVIQGVSQNAYTDPVDEQRNIAEAELLQGNPAQKYAAKGEIDMLNTLPKAVANKVNPLTDVDLESEYQKYITDPVAYSAGINSKPTYVKDQVKRYFATKGTTVAPDNIIKDYTESIKAVNRSEQLIDDLERMFNLVDENGESYSSKDFFTAKKKGISNKIASLIKSKVNPTQYEAFRNQLGYTLARSVGGEKGPLQKQDLQVWIDAIPSFSEWNSDTLETAAGKFANIRKQVEIAKSTSEDKLGEYILIEDKRYRKTTPNQPNPESRKEEPKKERTVVKTQNGTDKAGKKFKRITYSDGSVVVMPL